MTAGESLCRISFHLCERPVVLDHVVSVARPRVHDPRSAANPAPGRAAHCSGRHVQGIYLPVLDLVEDDGGTGPANTTNRNAAQARGRRRGQARGECVGSGAYARAQGSSDKPASGTHLAPLPNLTPAEVFLVVKEEDLLRLYGDDVDRHRLDRSEGRSDQDSADD